MSSNKESEIIGWIPDKNFKINLSWSVDDVLGQAKDDDVTLTPKQARKILENIERMHDASIGVNWEVISCHIDMYLQDHVDFNQSL